MADNCIARILCGGLAFFALDPTLASFCTLGVVIADLFYHHLPYVPA